MRNIILLMHISLDGYTAGPNGDMGWIRIDEEMFDHVGEMTAGADTALYGRVTYGMMKAYWPTAGDKPNATKHDIEHSKWTNSVTKLVFSRTMESTDWQNTVIIRDNIAEEMQQRKSEPGTNMLMIGSTTIAQEFMRLGLIDEYRLYVNPVVLGSGKRLFPELEKRVGLELKSTRVFGCGAVELVYSNQ